MKKLLLIILCIALLLTLTGCGEAKKYEEAKAKEAAGDYEAALKTYWELRPYEDADEQFDRLSFKMYDLAQEALNEGRYQEAMDLADPLLMYQADKLIEYAETALAGTYVQNAVYEAGRLSCAIAIAEDVQDASVRIQLYNKHGDFEGTAYMSSKADETSDEKGRFGLGDYRTGAGVYTLSSVELSAFPYSSDPGKAVVYNNGVFNPETTGSMIIVGGYEAIAQDGRKGFSPALGLLGSKFLSVDDAFAGGQVVIDIRSGKDVVFSTTLDIPAAEDR